jgi:hypothetical protein
MESGLTLHQEELCRQQQRRRPGKGCGAAAVLGRYPPCFKMFPEFFKPEREKLRTGRLYKSGCIL